jgi:phage host-nuclease inhibitor protein Gam
MNNLEEKNRLLLLENVKLTDQLINYAELETKYHELEKKLQNNTCEPEILDEKNRQLALENENLSTQIFKSKEHYDFNIQEYLSTIQDLNQKLIEQEQDFHSQISILNFNKLAKIERLDEENRQLKVQIKKFTEWYDSNRDVDFNYYQCENIIHELRQKEAALQMLNINTWRDFQRKSRMLEKDFEEKLAKINSEYVDKINQLEMQVDDLQFELKDSLQEQNGKKYNNPKSIANTSKSAIQMMVKMTRNRELDVDFLKREMKTQQNTIKEIKLKYAVLLSLQTRFSSQQEFEEIFQKSRKKSNSDNPDRVLAEMEKMLS